MGTTNHFFDNDNRMIHGYCVILSVNVAVVHGNFPDGV
jgi:hypothetical protein